MQKNTIFNHGFWIQKWKNLECFNIAVSRSLLKFEFNIEVSSVKMEKYLDIKNLICPICLETFSVFFYARYTSRRAGQPAHPPDDPKTLVLCRMLLKL